MLILRVGTSCRRAHTSVLVQTTHWAFLRIHIRDGMTPVPCVGCAPRRLDSSRFSPRADQPTNHPHRQSGRGLAIAVRQQQARAALMYRAPVALFHTTDKNNDPANKVGRGPGWDWMRWAFFSFLNCTHVSRFLAWCLLACAVLARLRRACSLPTVDRFIGLSFCEASSVGVSSNALTDIRG